MQNEVIAVILALVVLGLLIPPFRRDIKANRETFAAPAPESVFIRSLKKLKEYFKND